jgi:hypothetical protein
MEGEAMNAIGVVEGLIKAGTTIKDAWTNAKQRDPSMNWEKFITSSELGTAYEQVSGILNGLTQPAVDGALKEIRTKEAALLNGQSVMDLSADKLAQYDALLDVENQLMRKYAANFGKTADWVSWIVDEALPDLIRVAKVVVPLLL